MSWRTNERFDNLRLDRGIQGHHSFSHVVRETHCNKPLVGFRCAGTTVVASAPEAYIKNGNIRPGRIRVVGRLFTLEK
jgi:hypothetical protein